MYKYETETCSCLLREIVSEIPHIYCEFLLLIESFRLLYNLLLSTITYYYDVCIDRPKERDT